MPARLLTASTLALVALTRASAQMDYGRAPTPNDTMHHSIAAAEAEGARHPHAIATNPADPRDSMARGTVQRRCVIADELDMALSGDFLAGSFPFFRELWTKGYGKLIWRPRELPPAGQGLVVRATRLDTSGIEKVFEQPDITRGVNRTTSELSITKFYPSGFRIPTAGKWMLIATAGSNWGCFVITLP